ncbi:MAG: hypothetical protein GXP36_09750 [Actinobacteria bacterium]|nr:hypothetical protein [Actinomycetota bacterium]
MTSNDFDYLLRESLAMLEGLREGALRVGEERSDAVDLVRDALLAFAPAASPTPITIVSDAA